MNWAGRVLWLRARSPDRQERRAEKQPALCDDLRAATGLEHAPTFISFRRLMAGDLERPVRCAPAPERVRVDAQVDLHPLLHASARDTVVAAYLASDSGLGALLHWSVFHALPVGSRLIVLEDLTSHTSFEGAYYRQCAQVTGPEPVRGALKWTIEKRAAGVAEGFSPDAPWTFGIPTGPGDATILNTCVERILHLPIEKEIVLCGRPGANFKYLPMVRVVGEDIVAPPLRLARKKNRLAQEAKNPNFCTLHDRVLLPTNFLDGVRSAGTAPPFFAFQSVFFHDHTHLIGRRYSDYNVITWRGGVRPRVLEATGGERALDEFNSLSVPAIVEHARFGYQHPTRFSADSYLNGSLYLCRTDLWRLVQQNDALAWEELEDVEFGLRSSRVFGVPCKLALGALTQSMVSRPVVLSPCDHLTARGERREAVGATLQALKPVLPMKPIYAKVTGDVVAGYRNVVERHVAPPMRDVTLRRLRPELRSIRDRVFNVLLLVRSVQLPRTAEAIATLFDDLERWVFFETIQPHVRRRLIERMTDPSTGGGWEEELVTSTLHGSARLAVFQPFFAKSLRTFVRPSSFVTRALAFSWMVLTSMLYRQRFVFRGSAATRWAVIRGALLSEGGHR